MEIDELLDRRLLDGRPIADSDVRKLVDAYRDLKGHLGNLHEFAAGGGTDLLEFAQKYPKTCLAIIMST